MAGYWPSSCFCDFIDRDEVEVNKTAKRTRPIYSHLDRTSLFNKGFIIWPKRELVLAGPTRKIPNGQDGPDLLAWVAN